MPEQTFKSPNFYQREIDLSAPTQANPVGIPACIVGTANKGPAFVPVTAGNFGEYSTVFGGLDPKNLAPYAVNEFLKYRTALTFVRTLGAGANATDTDIATTEQTGCVTSAGLHLDGTVAADDKLGRHTGAVQFLTARHTLQADEAFGMPMFTDNDSFTGSTVSLIRGMLMLPTTARVMVLDGNEAVNGTLSAGTADDIGTVVNGKFKLIISSTLGNTFSNTDGNAGVKIFTASLDPSSADYFAKVLNNDPDKFVSEQHLLYADFPVDNEIATATVVGVLSGSNITSNTSGDKTLPMRKTFGAFNTRYTAPSTPKFISQPFGATEYDLFKFEAIDDGAYANTLYKIAITDLKASMDDSDKYGTFTVQIRDWNDTDINPVVLESFPLCSLNPQSDHYIAKLIGDRKVAYNFDASIESERRIVATGKYKNVSKYVRVIVEETVDRALVPQTALPFGFRGLNLPKTNDLLADATSETTSARLAGVLGTGVGSSLSGSIVPPIPFRVKVTKGEVPNTAAWLGQPGSTETPSSMFYWGVKFERNTLPLNSNIVGLKNELLASYSKFLGIKKLDALVTGSGADTLNDNKFTLAKVALSNTSVSDLTASVSQHMKEAAYIRDGIVDTSTYAVNDAVLGKRISLGTILAKTDAATFNKFSSYTKFVTFMAGGWDGVNILDRDARRMNDKASSFDAGGGAAVGYTAPGLGYNPTGTGKSNATVVSYRTAINIATDPMLTNMNVFAVPGIRESYITDYALDKIYDYGLAYYVMDIPSYDDDTTRLYDDSTTRPNVDQTANQFDSRVIDNNYGGTYFPNVYIDDETNKRRVKVPASVAALGAIAFNDKVAYPWYAPAGFNRAALDFVKNVEVRLYVPDRDRLYESRINPIATFPRLGYVIYGQKTLQIKKSALDRVNVRRLLNEVKRIIINIAYDPMFDNITPALWTKFTKESTLQLSLIQANSGIEDFSVVMNESNNSREDIELNRLHGTIVIVPVRTVEAVALDFIITKSGVTFTQ